MPVASSFLRGCRGRENSPKPEQSRRHHQPQRWEQFSYMCLRIWGLSVKIEQHSSFSLHNSSFLLQHRSILIKIDQRWAGIGPVSDRPVSWVAADILMIVQNGYVCPRCWAGERQKMPLFTSCLNIALFKEILIWPRHFPLSKRHTCCRTIFDGKIIHHYKCLHIHEKRMIWASFWSSDPALFILDIPIWII